jgi:hypothetical protein
MTVDLCQWLKLLPDEKPVDGAARISKELRKLCIKFRIPFPIRLRRPDETWLIKFCFEDEQGAMQALMTWGDL